MKILSILFLSFITFSTTADDVYEVLYDSVKILKLKTGKNYQVIVDGEKRSLEFRKIKNDTLFFTNAQYYFKDITSVRNKKRKLVLDIISFPVTVSSCLLMSAFPISYFQGYFQTDTDAMLKAVGFMAAQTVVFYISRQYIATNKKWVRFDSMKKLYYAKK